MSIGRIMQKAFNIVRTGKCAPKLAQTAGKVLPEVKIQPSVLSSVETGVSGRILRMQEAKQAFTPYATTVTHESAPTLQKMEEITGVARGKVADATGYFDKKRAADALAAFKQEPVAPIPVRQSAATVNYQPTQQVLDDIHNINKIEALKAYEKTGKLSDLPKDLAQKRLAANEAFSGNLSRKTPRYLVKLDKMILEHSQKCDRILAEKFAKIESGNGKFKYKCYKFI